MVRVTSGRECSRDAYRVSGRGKYLSPGNTHIYIYIYSHVNASPL